MGAQKRRQTWLKSRQLSNSKTRSVAASALRTPNRGNIEKFHVHMKTRISEYLLLEGAEQ